MKWLDHRAGICLTTWKLLNYFPKRLGYFLFLPEVYAFICVSFSPILDMVSLLNFSYSSRCEWYYIVGLIVCSQVISYFETLSYAYSPSMCLPWWSVCSNLLPILWWLGCLLSCYFWEFFMMQVSSSDASLLADKWFANCFSQSVPYLFISLIESFKEHKLNFDDSSISSFMGSVTGAESKKSAWPEIPKISSYVFF